MIERMKFLSIIGPEEDIDRMTKTYLTRYKIDLEDDPQQIRPGDYLGPYASENPYKEDLQKAEALVSANISLLPKESGKTMTPEDATALINEIDAQLGEAKERLADLTHQKGEAEDLRDKVAPFIGLNYDVEQILQFRYIKFRFGHVDAEQYRSLVYYSDASPAVIISKCQEDENTVWLVYFVPAKDAPEVDKAFEQRKFERFYLPDGYEGTPKEAYQTLEENIRDLQNQIDDTNTSMTEIIKAHAEELIVAQKELKECSWVFDIRQKAALTKRESRNFYVLCGWMQEEDALALQKEMEQESETFCILEEPDKCNSQPPTKLHNPKLFKPFEMYVEMYGLPDYQEFDPTIMVAISYSILFGFMFGDVGQGLLLLIGGYLLYHFRGSRLAGIISCCGFFSVIFGFLFGSFFGFENIIPALWLRPREAMTNLPFIGRLNTVFVVAIVVGMVVILLCMVLNIITSLKKHDIEKTYFDTNGVAGLIFYLAVVAVIVLYMTGHALPATGVLIVMFVLPLAVMFCKEPLTALAEREVKKMDESIGMFLIQGFFELFEVLLSYFSNTLSFVRVGAFAVSHAAMMGVVLMLAGAEAGGSINWIVIIIGNLFVCGMEGLVVGIQVLRLEYYEIFSRFYQGGGKPFVPYEIENS